jgi:hypothetical protein
MLIFGNRDFKEFATDLLSQAYPAAWITLRGDENAAARKRMENVRGHGFCQMFRSR